MDVLDELPPFIVMSVVFSLMGCWYLFRITPHAPPVDPMLEAYSPRVLNYKGFAKKLLLICAGFVL